LLFGAGFFFGADLFFGADFFFEQRSSAAWASPHSEHLGTSGQAGRVWRVDPHLEHV